MMAQLKRSEKLFCVLFLSLHSLKYNFNTPTNNYLYSQDVRCATGTSAFSNSGLTANAELNIFIQLWCKSEAEEQ
jgi:hypothetical protein